MRQAIKSRFPFDKEEVGPVDKEDLKFLVMLAIAMLGLVIGIAALVLAAVALR